MALTPGTRLGPYEVLSALGAGGMGEVYKARDTRLGRTVAIKVLPLDAAADVAARARFEREARAIATLSHPNICTVHDVGRHDGTDYLVMELLEGETLADRIARAKGPLALDEVLSIGMAIADALDKAHRAGIVHRDLKPANVMLTKAGPKLLDFGLAKLQGTASPVTLSGETNTTTAGPRTAKGTILGTIHYMAPEQVEGREADTRTDIWALGAVLYEMSTGQRPFDGDSPASIVGAILKDTPPALSTLQPLTPPAFARLVKKCLNKEADERWQSAKDLHDELQWIRENAGSDGAHRPGVDTRRERLRWGLVVTAIVAAGLALPAVRHLREAPSSLPEIRTEIETPAATSALPFALSPDGQQLVFVSSAQGEASLWVRPLASTEARQLPGTDGATYPFWSPDSRSVAFFADAKLKRMEVAGGRPQSLAAAVDGSGGTWNADGVIVFASGEGALLRMPASGGDAVAVTRLLDSQTIHRFPRFLPNGHQFLYWVQGAPDVAGIYLGALESPDVRRLTPAETAGAYLPSGWLLWVREGALMAQRLDVGRSTLTGDPVTVADRVAVGPGPHSVAALAVSGTGLIAYRAGGPAQRQLVWFDRSGTQIGTLGAPVDGDLTSPGLSPDGRRVVASRTVHGNTDIWLFDVAGASRFTFDDALDRFPIWSPDGSRVVFDSNRTGHRQLYQKRTDGAGNEELLLASAQDVGTMSWSPDGRFLLYRSQDPVTQSDLWVLPLEGDQKPRIFLKTPLDERAGTFSPDGRWVAYRSNGSGPLEIYVRPFSASGTASDAQWQISTAGGIQPRWRADGQELYYIAPDGTLMAAPIAVQNGALRPGAAVALFRTRIAGGGRNANAKQQYDVAADGRFLISVTSDDGPATPITLVQNWNPQVTR